MLKGRERPAMAESLVIEVPGDLVDGLDEIVALLGFRSREEFALVALRKMLDRHMALMRCLRSSDQNGGAAARIF